MVNTHLAAACTKMTPMNSYERNVDPAELAKFSDLAHRWWDPESEFRPLHKINPLRLDWINGLVPLSGLNVVDVGCGVAFLPRPWRIRGLRFWA